MPPNASWSFVLWSGLILSLVSPVVPASAEPPSEPASSGDAPMQPVDAPVSSAQEQPALPASEAVEPQAYRDIVGAALREYGEHHFEESRALFVKAHELFPNARTLRGLGMVEFERRNYLACIAYLEEALASTVRPLDDALRNETNRLIERARTFVGTLVFDVSPADARVLVDGALVDARAEIQLVAGEHVVEALASSFMHQSQRVSIQGGDRQGVTLHLVRIELADARADVAPQRSLWKSPWLWVGVGVALAAATTASVLLATPSPRTEEHVAPPERRDPSVTVLQALLRGTP